jgi:hypothetical protein
MISKRSSVVLLAITLAAGGTAACGGDDATGTGGTKAGSAPTATRPATNGTDTLPSKEALAKATEAYLAAESVHLKGNVVEDGEKISLDLVQTKKGDASGTVGLDGMKMTLLTIGKTAYISGDKAFWTKSAGAGAYATFKGKWIKTKLAGDDFKDLALFTNRAEFAKQVLPTDLLGGKPKDVNGAPAFGFTDNQGGNFYVALQGKPYPVRIDGTDGGSTVALDFLEYDKKVTFTPPPKSKVIEP